MIFKKLLHEITNRDIEILLKKMTNSFGYVEKLIKEIMLFTEMEIIKRHQNQPNFREFSPLKIKQSSTFKGACSFYLKREQSVTRNVTFFVKIRDLLTCVKLLCGIPCVLNLNHRLIGMIRNYIGAYKFFGSEQQIIYMYLVQELPVSE